MTKEPLFKKHKDTDYKHCAETFCEGYKKFLSASKTERLCVEYFVKEAKKAGFSDLLEKSDLKAGDKVYYINKNRSAIFAVIGEEDLEQGIRLVAAHIDSPRLDLKPVPVAEEGGLAYLRTHYYGGIKKYQWVATPLALYGVVVKKNGETVKIALGDREGDPVFMVTDLLPHLATKQMTQKMTEGILGEKLMVLSGSNPDPAAESDEVKTALLQILQESYGISEEDFFSAEIEVVPAGAARDVGFDRSMVASYGHDDRVCAYTALEALLQVESPKQTAAVLLADREEVGSMGNSGMQSKFLEFFLEELKAGVRINRVMANTVCLSSDVAAAYDPMYADVYEKQNAPLLGCGLTLMRYTGSRGKGGSSEASAELTATIRRIFDDHDVSYQFAELGKVDEGGGGTVAQYIANSGADVIDAGVALLCMHAPYEIAHKADIYEAYRAYVAFLKD